MVGLDEDLTSTVLVDNKATNVAEFREYGGQAVLFVENGTVLDELFVPMVS